MPTELNPGDEGCVVSQVSVVTKEEVWGLWSLYNENVDHCSMTSMF
jgi:hypothetical protein